jgi:hypothetical protein
MSFDVAVCLIVLVSAWLIAHSINASYWYNRNLVIIANIERQFLSVDDLKHIQYYFGKHRETGTMMTHLRIQVWLGCGIAAVMLAAHFFERVAPGFASSIAHFSWWRALPYITSVAALVGIGVLCYSCNRKYREFVNNSPGIEVNTTGIIYGAGHPPFTPDAPQ